MPHHELSPQCWSRPPASHLLSRYSLLTGRPSYAVRPFACFSGPHIQRDSAGTLLPFPVLLHYGLDIRILNLLLHPPLGDAQKSVSLGDGESTHIPKKLCPLPSAHDVVLPHTSRPGQELIAAVLPNSPPEHHKPPSCMNLPGIMWPLGQDHPCFLSCNPPSP